MNVIGLSDCSNKLNKGMFVSDSLTVENLEKAISDNLKRNPDRLTAEEKATVDDLIEKMKNKA